VTLREPRLFQPASQPAMLASRRAAYLPIVCSFVPCFVRPLPPLSIVMDVCTSWLICEPISWPALCILQYSWPSVCL
jgi:hypothetical protein